MPAVYSTDEISLKERFTFWNDVICKTYLTVDCAPVAGCPVSGRVSIRQLGRIEISEVYSPAMVYNRSNNELRGNHEEHYQLVLLLDGEGALRQDGRDVVLAPGDIALYSASRPSTFSSFGSRTMVFKIPRQVLAHHIVDADRLTAVKMSSYSPLTSMVGNLMRESFVISECTGLASQEKFVGGVLDIVGVSLETIAGVRKESSVKGNLLEKVKRHIADNIADSELQVETIAHRNNVSVRTLNRLFAAEQTTAVKWLWSQRLAASYEMLAQRKVRQVSEAALNCGFNDLSHFSKAFKREYMISPNEVLASGHRTH
ncbi:Transcriptional activator NphR [Pseudomonas extremaustralis]|uniref:Transcriptional activator NphR n=1 Tax=Pseudomonas extremaustralis TaxID=359110 RepID=A0A5M9J290_9PSED|nr:helix-turn-helix domain-containing protein [Pseudomonas extremaustralis]KAA8562767.1 Transcriptional activator NphR [Pseudomonas extremaustralis]